MPDTTPATLLRLPEVLKRTGLTRSCVYDMIRAGAFPRQIKLGPGGRAAAWVESEVQDWIQKQISNDRGSEQEPATGT